MGSYKTYTEKQIKLIEYLCSQGMTDMLICKKTKTGYGFVQLITTKYWKQKMKNKLLKQ